MLKQSVEPPPLLWRGPLAQDIPDESTSDTKNGTPQDYKTYDQDAS